MFSGSDGWRSIYRYNNIVRNGYILNEIFKSAISFWIATRTPLVENGPWISSWPHTLERTGVSVLCRSRLKPESTIDQRPRFVFLRPPVTTDTTQNRDSKQPLSLPGYCSILEPVFSVQVSVLLDLAHNCPLVCGWNSLERCHRGRCSGRCVSLNFSITIWY